MFKDETKKKYHTIGTAPKSNSKIVERDKINTLTHKYTWPLTFLALRKVVLIWYDVLMRISLYFLSGKASSIGVVTFSPNFLNTILHLVYYRDSTSSYLEGYLGMK